MAGPFGVVRDGIELPEGEVGSRKSRTLLKLLAVERPGLVPLDRIVEVLWDGEPPAAAEQNVASLVSRLRGVLGSGVIQGGLRVTGWAAPPRSASTSMRPPGTASRRSGNWLPRPRSP